MAKPVKTKTILEGAEQTKQSTNGEFKDPEQGSEGGAAEFKTRFCHRSDATDFLVNRQLSRFQEHRGGNSIRFAPGA